MKAGKGVITVFFTLCITAFLGLFFLLIESVRVQGARAQAANITDMGNYSLFSEYEKKLLSSYELFAVDGGYGGNALSVREAEARLEEYLGWNVTPDQEGLPSLCFDPWHLRLTGTQITSYALLSDEGGCGFYEQAVAYMRKTAVAGMTEKLYEYFIDAQELEELSDEYERAKKQSDTDLEDAREQEEEILSETASGETVTFWPTADPLKELAGVIRNGVWESVRGDLSVSSENVSGRNLASHRMLKKGSLKLPAQYGSITDDLLFREYLLDRFPNLLESRGGAGTGGNCPLSAQTEYLIAGKTSDLKNMKSVALRLVMLREGVNYLYCLQDTAMSAIAGETAWLLAGWTGLAGVVEAVRHALLIGWAYGESLIDVKILLAGGKVPLRKSADSWYLTMDRFCFLREILAGTVPGNEDGLDYRGHLRLLLNLQGTGTQARRGLDLIELNLAEGGDSFRVDRCIVAVNDRTDWSIPPLFSRVTGAFLGESGGPWKVSVNAGFSYQ